MSRLLLAKLNSSKKIANHLAEPGVLFSLLFLLDKFGHPAVEAFMTFRGHQFPVPSPATHHEEAEGC